MTWNANQSISPSCMCISFVFRIMFPLTLVNSSEFFQWMSDIAASCCMFAVISIGTRKPILLVAKHLSLLLLVFEVLSTGIYILSSLTFQDARYIAAGHGFATTCTSIYRLATISCSSATISSSFATVFRTTDDSCLSSLPHINNFNSTCSGTSRHSSIATLELSTTQVSRTISMVFLENLLSSHLAAVIQECAVVRTKNSGPPSRGTNVFSLPPIPCSLHHLGQIPTFSKPVQEASKLTKI